jgi:hypothetical protein
MEEICKRLHHNISFFAVSYSDEGVPMIFDGETMVNNAIAVASYNLLRSWVITDSMIKNFG